MNRLVISAVLAVSAVLSSSVQPSAQTPDKCTEQHFGYFFLRSYSNNSGGPIKERDLFKLPDNRTAQVQLLAGPNSMGGAVLIFGNSDGTVEQIEAIGGTSLVRVANSLKAKITGTGSIFLAGCFRFI
jgi:hypothetical protein